MIKPPSHILLHGVSSPHLFFVFPLRDHNENKVFLDLYYAILATVFLDVLVMILL